MHFSNGPCLRKGYAMMEDHDGSANRFKGNEANFTAAKKRLLNNLIHALSQRFPEKDVGLVKATKVLDFSSWPHKDESAGEICELFGMLLLVVVVT